MSTHTNPSIRSLPITGLCPLCGISFNGLKIHYVACSKKFAKLKDDYLIFGADAVSNLASSKTKSNSRLAKICESCNKKYIFKHKCLKIVKNIVHESETDVSNIFNFSDSFFSDESLFKSKESGFDFESTSLPDSFDFNSSSFPEATNWANCLDKFNELNPNKIKIMHLNINSVFCKLHELNIILNKLLFDFVFIQESKLCPELPDAFISNTNYGLIRRDRKAGGGGLLVYYKKSYSILNPLIDSTFETITFSVLLNKTKHTFISSYNPHFKFTPIYLNYLDLHLKNLISSNHSNITLIGDLNQDLHSSNGDNLKSLMENYNFKSYQNLASRVAKTSSTCLDVVFSTSDSLIDSVETFKAPFSDHNFVCLALNQKSIKTSPSSVETRSLTEAKLDLIDIALQNAPFSLISGDALGSMNDKFFTFKKLITDILDTIAPFKSIRIKNNNLPWVDDEMRKALQERDKLHTYASDFPKSDPIWENFRACRNSCKSMLRRKMFAFYSDKTSSYFKSSKKFWAFYKSVVKTKKSSVNQIIPNVFDANTKESFSEPVDVARIFNEHFTNIKCEAAFTDEDCLDYVRKSFISYKREGKLKVGSFSFKKITATKVFDAISQLDPSSSSGITDIPVKLLKRSSKVLSPILACLFNQFVDSGNIPDDLKCALAFPLFKKGDATSCDNYRGISILSPIAKIFERILSADITEYFVENQLFSDSQHGFRTKRSCETALQTILDKWKLSIEAKRIILALFIDFKKAFDLIDPKLLFIKLFHYGFDNIALNLIRNYFTGRTQITKIGKSSSSRLSLEWGVPQGSIFGPLLFIIFINDLSLILDSFLESILFADDTSLHDDDVCYEALISRFRSKFTILFEWINHNKLFLNWSKTKFMIINSHNPNTRKPRNIELEDNLIEVVSEFKLLGCLIDDKLSFKQHVKNIKTTVCRKLFAIKNIFFLSFDIKIHFFKTFLLPHFDYCASLFIYFSNTLVNKLNKLYNLCLFVLLRLELNNIPCEDQQTVLKPLNLLPFKYRLLLRFSLFSHKIMNGEILNDIKAKLTPSVNVCNTRAGTRNIFMVPFSRSHCGGKRISIFLPIMVNNVLRNSSNLVLREFKEFILTNISNLFLKFSKFILLDC